MQPSTARLTALHEEATMERGYIKLFRKLKGSSIWLLDPVTFKAAIYLLLEANYEPRTEFIHMMTTLWSSTKALFAITKQSKNASAFTKVKAVVFFGCV